MPHFDPDRLALVALGEEVATAEESAHLATCPECAADLEDLAHTAAVGRASIDGQLETPAPRVWERIADELGLDGATSTVAPVIDLPATRRARQGEHPEQPQRRRPWVWVLTAAAAIALVAGVGVGLTVWLQPAVTQLASATLDALPDHAGANGSAAVDEQSDGSRVLSVSLDASAIGTGYREVWLLTADATGLISLGVLDGDRGTFVIPQGVDLDEFNLVDVSVEPTDGDPAHSGDSIVRGPLQFS